MAFGALVSWLKASGIRGTALGFPCYWCAVCGKHFARFVSATNHEVENLLGLAWSEMEFVC
ncbi:hypothetical protein MAGR_19940 [Mycolicibacterium agri]|uniref:C2H2-type domain-containing protein n=1 Tax=Mycolicibacterium agri TaxID=36811 RepID=A0A7I9VYR3_MYCAG|nr:hypothetical protein MAGR_19940 [Mycolicibacterium agri]